MIQKIISGLSIIVRCLVLVGLYLINPVFKIKLFLVGQTSIGATVGCLEIFLRKCNMGTASFPNCYHAFVVGLDINSRITTMYSRQIPVIRSQKLFWLTNGYPLRGSKFVERLPYEPSAEDQYYDQNGDFHYEEYNYGSPSLRFTDAEEAEGRSLLESMGIPYDAWFVCFHARDDGYWEQFQPDSRYPERTSYRNCSINNFIDAMRYVVACGGYAVRVGAGTETPLEPMDEPRIVDYSTSYWCEFGDIYLLAKCKFLVGCCTGLNVIAHNFNVPMLATNTAPITHDLMIPMHVFSHKLDRQLTIPEILDSEISNYWLNRNYVENELYTVQNSAVDILDATREMNERLDGVFAEPTEIIEIRDEYVSLLGPKHRSFGSPATLASTFINNHPSLFSQDSV